MVNRKVLVTGGAGFIGSHLVDLLLTKGFHVTVLDNLDSQVHGVERSDNHQWPPYLNKYAEVVYGDVRDYDLVSKLVKKATHVVHLAASVGVGQSMYHIVDYTSNNDLGAATLLQAIAELGAESLIERMVVASSMSIYGEGLYTTTTGELVAPELRTKEQLLTRQWEMMFNGEILEPLPTTENKKLQPSSVYAINKQVQEQLFLVVGQALGIPTVALRFFNVYGTRQSLSNPYTGVAAIFASRLLNNLPPLIFEDGEQRRDFVSVKDICRAIFTVLNSDKLVWDAYNVGSGDWITVNGVARVLAKGLMKDIEPVHLGKYRVGDIRHCYADVSKIGRDFDFVPSVDFDDGMAELTEWLQSDASQQAKHSTDALGANKLVI